MHTTWIDRPEQLAEFCAQIDPALLAVDTESDHFHAYDPRVCLIQVATPGAAAYIDPLALGKSGLDPLFELLDDPDTTTLLHSAANDIRALHQDFEASFSNIFDTQLAASFLGYERNGLSWLQKHIIGKTPPGQFQCYNWRTRPLPARVREYAIADAVDLFALHERFLAELKEAGWLDAFHQQCALVAASSDFEPSPFDPDGWWKVFKRYGRGLDGRGRAALRELFVARHEICTEENRAPVHIFPNKALSALAKKRPQTLGALERLDILHEEVVAYYGVLILDAIERSLGSRVPPKKRPSKGRGRRSQAPEALRQALIDWRNRAAARLDLPGQLIATNQTLSEIAQDPPQNIDGLDAFPSILEWHRRLLGEEILQIIQKIPAPQSA